jgi:hypothetical protein
VNTRDVEHKGCTHHANPDAPQYEVKSVKTDHIAFHKGSAAHNASQLTPLLPGAIDDTKRLADAHTPATSLD